jgi:hypothetical protein
LNVIRGGPCRKTRGARRSFFLCDRSEDEYRVSVGSGSGGGASERRDVGEGEQGREGRFGGVVYKLDLKDVGRGLRFFLRVLELG